MTIQEVVERARAAYKSGVKPRRGWLGVLSGYDGAPLPFRVVPNGNGCCGIGAALIGLTGPTVLGALDIEPEQRLAFENGFDGFPRVEYDPNYAWSEAGADLAAEVGLTPRNRHTARF